MVNRKSGRKAPTTARFDASYVPAKKSRSTKAAKRAGKKPVKKAASKAPAKRASESKVVQDDKDYEVEAVWGVQRISKHFSDIDVLLKWVGWKEATWETLENAKHSSELLKPFKRAIDRLGGKLKLPDEDAVVAGGDSSDEDESDGKNKEYEVEDIIGVRYAHDDGRIEYLVKWKSYPYGQCTWEPLENVEDLPEYLDFFKEAVEVLVDENRIGIEPRKGGSKKRRSNEDNDSQNTEDVDEDGAGDEPKPAKRGRPGPASRKIKTAAAGSANGSSRKKRRSRR